MASFEHAFSQYIQMGELRATVLLLPLRSTGKLQFGASERDVLRKTILELDKKLIKEFAEQVQKKGLVE